MSSPRKALAALAVVSLALAGCGSSGGSDTSGSETPDGASSGGASGETLTIGSIHPLTGGLAGVGQLMQDATELAVEDINAAGGIKSLDGAKLEIASGDSQGKAEVGQSEAQRLTQAGAVALVGTYQSDVTQTVASVAERSQVPLIIDVAVDDNILAQGYKYSFRIQPDATGMGIAGADALAALGEQGGSPIETVSYIHIQGAYGDSVFSAFQEQAQAKGITIAKEVTYDGGSLNDAATQVAEAAAANPDVIVVTGYFPDSLLIAKAIAARKPDIKGVYGVANGGFDDDSFPAAAAAAGNGLLSANYHYDATNDRATDIRTRFEAKYGEQMETAAMLSYQAVEVVAAGLEKSGSDDPVKLRDAIADLEVTDPLLAFDGPITFDETGQNTNATVIVMQILDGKVEQVYPDSFATADLVFPVTPGA